MTYSSGPFISENPELGESSFDTLEQAPPEAVVEQLKRGNPEAFSAMLAQLGTSEEEFISRIEKNFNKTIKEELISSLGTNKDVEKE